VAMRALKTRPEACRVLSRGRGRVVIWIEEPMMLLSRKSSMPSCHRRRRYGARRGRCLSFSSSSMCDLRCKVRPTDWTHVDMRPTTTPSWSVGLDEWFRVLYVQTRLTPRVAPGDNEAMVGWLWGRARVEG
jgi:hypothetical protein